MPTNQSLFRRPLRWGGAVVTFAALVVTTSAASAGTPQTLTATATVERPAAATQQARRLSLEARQPIFPMQTTPMCYILDNFGAPRSGGRTHEGTDMLAKLDQAVYAVVDGTLGSQVIDGQANSSLSGNSWRLTVAGATTFYVYAHMSHFAAGLTNGSVVTQGRLIGYVGDTGNPGPGNYHLHFEVHPDGGAAINPLSVLTVPSACTVQRNAG